jgi:SAM-dependent methyltransferase
MNNSIKKKLIWVHNIFTLFGLNPIKFIATVRGLPFYFSDLRELKKQKTQDMEFPFGNSLPMLNERNSEAGTMSGHYFHQDLFIARKIFLADPVSHVDIGSRTDGFVAHVAVFREIEIFDIRTLNSSIQNIIFKQANLMELDGHLVDYCDSISSLHAIEHFGLGRYGDPIDYNGHVKAIRNIHKVLKKNGTFYFSVPIGEQRIEFNAHRVFSLKYLIDTLRLLFSTESFSFVNDKGEFFENADLTEEQIKVNFNCHYGCGIFELKKI